MQIQNRQKWTSVLGSAQDWSRKNLQESFCLLVRLFLNDWWLPKKYKEQRYSYLLTLESVLNSAWIFVSKQLPDDDFLSDARTHIKNWLDWSRKPSKVWSASKTGHSAETANSRVLKGNHWIKEETSWDDTYCEQTRIWNISHRIVARRRNENETAIRGKTKQYPQLACWYLSEVRQSPCRNNKLRDSIPSQQRQSWRLRKGIVAAKSH